VDKYQKLIEQIFLAQSDANIDFSSLCGLLEHLGFKQRIKGSHHIFHKSGVREIINIQPLGTKAKPYQVKQIRNLFLAYKIGGKSNE